ncbi:sugar transferase [Oscillospiraceae bacterium WX1]
MIVPVNMIYRRVVKRPLDVALSSLALLLFSPVMAVTAICIGLTLGKPILFRQTRIGKDEKAFMMLKFRTLTDQKDDDGTLLCDHRRLTQLGRFLRGTGLDELPELVNIIRGDMSLVGPRPLLTGYLPYFTAAERARHRVRGGLIPPEVLYGNIRPTWAEQLQYEADYAANVSFLQDARIFLKALWGLFHRKNTDYGGYVRRQLSAERQSSMAEGGEHR